MMFPTLDKIATNFTRVDAGDVVLWFSYSTLIAFRVYKKGGPIFVVRENDWKQTTGKHLNFLSKDKKERVPTAEFKKLYDEHVGHLIKVVENDR